MVALVYVGRESFVEITDRETAKRIFASTILRVEVETHSYCNRRCSYCPNVVGDRLGPNEHMAAANWEKLLSGLGEIDYDKYFVLNYYNEPLADRAILDRIREARARVPRARLMLYTNGDYLDPEYVDALGDAGLDYMHVSIHLKRGDVYSNRYVINRLIEISVRIGIPARMTRIVDQEYLVAVAPHPKLEIEIRGINFSKHGTDRGGLIPEIETSRGRSAPCFFPFAHFVVGYDGSIAPCCHIRSDRAEHQPYVLGNLADHESIFQAFMNGPAAAWRRELGSDKVKRSPCDTCQAGQLDSAEAKLMADWTRSQTQAPA